ncbi:hypothetical protein [Telmatospirillum siberiense]|uniref:Uncharacterized protein n=1 Tax=Telmatospirillum siberiense TaxID=382514 RepID=A0A2N3PW92_9PROT|nr:hypothetical protein [Telmatospirillum siberiense]PKU24667.1 hypothetical protein CWS72_10000 [Telmatospirillum siberiense]
MPPDESFEVLFSQLLTVPEWVWDRLVLEADTLIRRIPEDRKEPLCRMACSVGHDLAENHVGGTPERRPSALAQSLGLTLGEETDGPFASFTEPRSIRVDVAAVAAADALLERTGQRAALGGVSLYEVLVGHELFHYFEMVKPELPTSQKLLTTWKLGLFEGKSRILALGEIAAMAFARRLTGAPFAPFVLTFVLFWATERTKALDIHAAAVGHFHPEKTNGAGSCCTC